MHVHAKITDNRLPSKHMPTYPHLGIKGPIFGPG